MTQVFKSFAILASTVLLTGCSVFYPNWGATSLPEEPFDSSTQSVETAEPTAEPEPTETETQAAEPEPEPTETQAPEPKNTPVEIIMAVVEPDFGVLTVIAQLPGVNDTGGTCTLRFQSGNFEHKVTVKAEPSSDYTQCFPIEVPLKDLKSGKGLVTVNYESASYVGKSAASSVEIP